MVNGEECTELSDIEASDFLQKYGLARTGIERKKEIKDVDINSDNMISFTEYLMLHFKAMILTEYYKRMEKTCPHDLSKGGVGIVGVGNIMLDELFTLPIGLSPALVQAIEDMTAQKSKAAKLRKSLEEKAAKGGVRGMTAKNELAQLDAQDGTELRRLELTLEAAKKKGAKNSGAEALEAKKKAEIKAMADKRAASRRKLAERAKMFQ